MKKIVIIWSNCQGASIHSMLNKYYSHLFEVKQFSNYEYIKNNLSLPKCIQTADFFLYQNYADNKPVEYNLDNILNKELNDACIKICFPTLHSCTALFGYSANEPKNAITISGKFPHGKFFYGISAITDILNERNCVNFSDAAKTNIIHEIYEKTQHVDFIKKETMDYHYNRTFDFLKGKILSSDIPELFEFIEFHFNKHRLWHNQNHPTGILLNELVKRVFSKMSLEYNINDEPNNIIQLDNSLNDWTMPIFPCVKNYYNMDFEDKCSSWYHPEIVNANTYINKYITDIYLS